MKRYLLLAVLLLSQSALAGETTDETLWMAQSTSSGTVSGVRPSTGTASGVSSSSTTTTSPQKQSCRTCWMLREQCLAPCDKLSSGRENLQCVNRCNAAHMCIEGDTCNR